MAPFYEAGRYRVEVINQSFSEASTGTVQFVLRFRVLKCVDPRNENLPSWERRAWFPITPNTGTRVLADLRTLGSTARRFLELHPDTDGFYNFVGREIEVFCIHEPDYHNPKEMRERWSIRGERPLANKTRLDELDRALTGSTTHKPNGGAFFSLDRDDVLPDDVPPDDDVPF
jgi:hypothetical protein